MSHKFLFVVALLAATAAISYAGLIDSLKKTVNGHGDGKIHHLDFGKRQNGDSLLHRQIVDKKGHLLRTVSTDFKFVSPHGERITMVRALDQNTKGEGASASLTNGGLTRGKVQLHFESQRGHGIDFVVEIYGHK